MIILIYNTAGDKVCHIILLSIKKKRAALCAGLILVAFCYDSMFPIPYLINISILVTSLVKASGILFYIHLAVVWSWT